MSDNMSTPSVGAEEFAAVEIDEAFYSLIPSRFPTVDVFARVTRDRSRELAEIESMTNPRLREKARVLSGIEVVDGNSPLLQNWNHAPFTYHNPEGSRFFSPEQPALELAGDMQTALAISVRKRELFLSRTEEEAIGLEMRELSRRVKGRFVDGREWRADLEQDERLRLGRAVVNAGFDGILYRPVERPSGHCICVLKGDVLERAVQRDHFKFVWDGSRIKSIYSFGSGNEFGPEELRGVAEIMAT